MKQAGYTKRPRGRSSERQKKSQKLVSPKDGETKTCKNPNSAVEKYLALAQDAVSSGDSISAENYYQYADHYYRVSIEKRLQRSSERHIAQRKKPSPPLSPIQ